MLKRQRIALIYGAALITGDLPLKDRLTLLSKHFTPKPGAEIAVDEYAAKEFGAKDRDRGLLYGIIEVSPPKGTCFTISTSEDRGDIEVCKKTPLRWRMQDLDRLTGKLIWKIKTGPGDFGTPVEWRTNYIIAKVIPSSKDFGEADSTPIFIRSCRAIAADPSVGMGRRIELDLFSGKKWLIRFPERDEIIPTPPPPATPPPIEDKKKPAHGEGKGEGEGEGEHAAPTPTPEPTPKPPAPEAWTLSTRRGFEMDVSGFLTGVSTPPGTKGKCRYQYDGAIGDFSSGRMECHYSDEFTYVYMPLPCIKYLQKK